MTSHNQYTPAFPTQIGYLLEWFREWGDMQRGDFLPVLASKFSNNAAINGIVAAIDSATIEDRPPSLFKCRIKLFNQWSATWSDEEKETLVSELGKIDPDFVRKYENKVKGILDEEVDVDFMNIATEVSCQ